MIRVNFESKLKTAKIFLRVNGFLGTGGTESTGIFRLKWIAKQRTGLIYLSQLLHVYVMVSVIPRSGSGLSTG